MAALLVYHDGQQWRSRWWRIAGVWLLAVGAGTAAGLMTAELLDAPDSLVWAVMLPVSLSTGIGIIRAAKRQMKERTRLGEGDGGHDG